MTTETKSTHTPGPWVIHDEKMLDGRLVVSTEAVNDIITIIGDIYNPDAEANARLIAAAPELLEAVRIILESPELKNCPDGRWSTADSENYWRRAKLEAAIAKAEGKS